MPQLTAIEVIIIFGGLAILYVVSAILRLRHKLGKKGIESLAGCYIGTIVVGLYLAFRIHAGLGTLIMFIGVGGVVYESIVGKKL